MKSILTFARIFSLVLLASPIQERIFQVTPVRCIRRADRQEAATASSRVESSEIESQAISLDHLEGALADVDSSSRSRSEDRSDEAVPARMLVYFYGYCRALMNERVPWLSRFFPLIFSLVVRFVCSLFHVITYFIFPRSNQQNPSRVTTNSESESQEAISLDQLGDDRSRAGVRQKLKQKDETAEVSMDEKENPSRKPGNNEVAEVHPSHAAAGTRRRESELMERDESEDFRIMKEKLMEQKDIHGKPFKELPEDKLNDLVTKLVNLKHKGAEAIAEVTEGLGQLELKREQNRLKRAIVTRRRNTIALIKKMSNKQKHPECRIEESEYQIEEKKWHAEDLYTLAEFIERYGGSAEAPPEEWVAAPRVCQERRLVNGREPMYIWECLQKYGDVSSTHMFSQPPKCWKDAPVLHYPKLFAGA